MSLFVMYNSKGRPSARKLARALQQNTEGLIVNRGLPSSKRLRQKKFNYIINVGNSTKSTLPRETTVINPPGKIAVSANKRLARMRFKARKVPAPQLWLQANQIPNSEFPVVGRTTYHMKANGFWFCNNKKEALKAERAGATHFLKFIDNTREFRAHVFSTTTDPKSSDDYVIARLAEKRNISKSKDTIIKNHDNGYKFVTPYRGDKKALNSVREVARLAISKFGLHYGAVDIMYSLDHKRPYVLEINTTPCLTDEASSTLDVYVDKLIDLIGAQRQ